MTGVFWSYDERRLRVLWRLVGVGVCTVILTFIFGIPFFAASGASPAPYVEKLVLYAAAAVAIWLATRFLDRRRSSDAGLYVKRDWWIDLGFGMVLGAILMTVVFLVELVAGWVTIRETFYTADSAQPFIVAILLPALFNLVVGIGVRLAVGRLEQIAPLFASPVVMDGIAFLTLIFPVILYFTLQESSPRQATWGKRKVGIKVVNVDMAGQRVHM